MLTPRSVDRICAQFGRVLISCVAFSPWLCGEIRVLGVTTAAAFVPGMPAPGSLATLFCTGLQGINGVQIASETPLPRVLADVRVTNGTLDVPLLAIADLGAYQIVNFQVPWEGLPGPWTVSQGSDRTVFTASPASWAQFFTDSSGDALAQHASDYRPVTPSDPARPNEWIVLYGTNFGNVWPKPATGFPAAAQPLSRWIEEMEYDVVVMQANQSSFVYSNYLGLAPGTVGVYQLNVQMPSHLEPGTASVFVRRSIFCGFFYTPGCGRGWVFEPTTMPAKLRVAP